MNTSESTLGQIVSTALKPTPFLPAHIKRGDCHTTSLLIRIIFNDVFAFIAVIVNALIIIGMWKDRKSSMSFLLIHLAISNTMVAVGWGTYPVVNMVWQYSKGHAVDLFK